MIECRRYIIKGRVQGVWFRDSTRRKAYELSLTGHAINLSDGSVEVIACGEKQALEVIRTWLEQGPELAQVTGVESSNLPVRDYSGFTIG